MTLFWLILAVIIVWAVMTGLTRNAPAGRLGGETPEERLDRRLADGEIDVETYDEIALRLRHERDAASAAMPAPAGTREARRSGPRGQAG